MAVSQASINDYLKQYGYGQPTMTSPVQQADASVFEAQQMQAVQTAEDGCDDGKISFGKKAKNFGKGCLKFITGMFTGKDGKFSLKQTLKTVAVIAATVAVSVATAGTAAAPALAMAGIALGVVSGGTKIVKGAVKASKATTDAEAENAWQDIGLGTTTLGVSVAGAKGVMKSATGGTFKGNALKATKECFVQTGKNALKAGKSIKGSFKAGTLKADAASLIQQGKSNFASNAKSMFGSNKAVSNFQNKEIAKIDKQIAKLDATKDADMISKLTAQKQALNTELGHIQNATSTDDIANIIKSSEDRISSLKAAGASADDIAAAEQQLKVLQTAGNIQTGYIKNLVAQTQKQADKIAKLSEKIAKLDSVKDAEKMAKLTAEKNNLINNFNSNKKVLSSFDVTKLDKITAQEAKALVRNQYVTPLKRPVINQIKNNPFIGRNVEEALLAQGLTPEQIAQIEAQVQGQQATQAQQNPQAQYYMPQFAPVDYTSQYFDQFRYNNPFQA